MAQLTGKRVAIVVADGFEQDELEKSKHALEAAGATIEIVSPNPGKVKAWKYAGWGTEFKIDLEVEQADPNQYDALILPGGQIIPDNLRMNRKVVDFVASFVRSGKPIAAICHSPWTLIEAKGLLGKPYLNCFLPGMGTMVDYQISEREYQDRSCVDPELGDRLTELMQVNREVDMNAVGLSVLSFIEEKIGADRKHPPRSRERANDDQRDHVRYINVQLSPQSEWDQDCKASAS
jgi:putative intracellular protease/amidase